MDYVRANKYTSSSPKGSVLYIKEKKLCTYQLEISDLHNITIGNVKKLELNFFQLKKACPPLQELATLLETRIKTKNIYIYHVLEFNQSQWLKPYVKFKGTPNY